jgi:hypothetical protein
MKTYGEVDVQIRIFLTSACFGSGSLVDISDGLGSRINNKDIIYNWKCSLSIYLSIYLSVCLSVCLSVYLSIHLLVSHILSIGHP